MADLDYAPGGVEDRVGEPLPVAGTKEGKEAERSLLLKSLLIVAGLFGLTTLAGFLFAGGLTLFAGDGQGYLNETGYMVSLFVLLGAAIAQMVMIPFIVGRAAQGKGVLPLVLCHAVLEGVFFASFLVVPGVTWATVLEALLIATGSFLLAAGVGYFLRNAGWLMTVGMSLLIVGSLLSLGWALVFFLAPAYWSAIDCAVSVIFVVAMLLFVAVDASRIRKMAAQGAGARNLSLFCGFLLYSDFMALFLRILYIVIRSKRD